MLNGRRFAGKRLPLTIGFAILIIAAFGMGCKGFFQPNSLQSIAIQPPSPQVAVGQSTTLQAWGTYQDNTRSQITSGVAWTSSDNTTVSIDPNTGQITGENSGGTATITAAAQGLSGTATATAFLANVTGLTICSGTFNTGVCPAATWTVTGTVGGNQTYYAKGTSNSTTVDVTTVATWTVSPTPGTGTIDCTNSGASPETCTVANPTSANTYTLTVTYPGTTPATATIKVN